MSIHIRGFAPAIRVMSRREPPALARGSCPSTRLAPARLTITFASTCGRWLVSATRRSCATGSIATGKAPSSATKPWTSRCRSASVCAVGVRNQVAPSNRPAEALSGPRASDPVIGCPPTNRADPRAAATTLAFVEPTSVTVVSSPVAARTAATCAGSSAIGAATTASSASASAAPSEFAASTASRCAAIARACGSGSQPTTRAPLAFAARPSEAPISPVPTMVSLVTTTSTSLRDLAASARRGGRRGRATGARSGAGRRASRSGDRAAPRRAPRSRRGIR